MLLALLLTSRSPAQLLVTMLMVRFSRPSLPPQTAMRPLFKQASTLLLTIPGPRALFFYLDGLSVTIPLAMDLQHNAVLRLTRLETVGIPLTLALRPCNSAFGRPHFKTTVRQSMCSRPPARIPRASRLLVRPSQRRLRVWGSALTRLAPSRSQTDSTSMD